MPLCPDNFQDWLKERNMEPVISRLTYEQHKRIDDAEPDRRPGMLAAYEYLNGRVHHIELSSVVAALLIIGMALAIGVVVWGRA